MKTISLQNTPYFNRLDIFGFSFNFLVGENDRYKSSFGAFLTIIYFFIIIALFMAFGADMYLRKKPRSSYNSEQGQYEKLYLSNENFTYAFRVHDQLFNYINDERILRFEAWNIQTEVQNGKLEVKVYKQIPVKKCVDLPYSEDKKKLYNTSLDEWNCVDFNDTVIGGNGDANFYNSVRVLIKQCLNTTLESNCATVEEFKNIFNKNNHIFLSDLALQIKPSIDNIDNPLKASLKPDFDLLSLEMTKIKEIIFQKTLIDDDKGWLFPQNVTKSFSSLYETRKDFSMKDSWNSDIISGTQISFGRNYEKYTRSFTKIQDVMASVGGFSSLFLAILNILFTFFTNANRNIFLANNIKFYDDLIENSFDKSATNRNVLNNNNSDKFKVTIIKNNNNLSKIDLDRQITITQYLKYFVCRRRNMTNERCKNILTNYKLYNNYFKNVLNVLTYFNMYNEFYTVKKLFLDEDERKTLKNILPNLNMSNNTNFNMNSINKSKSDSNIENNSNMNMSFSEKS